MDAVSSINNLNIYSGEANVKSQETGEVTIENTTENKSNDKKDNKNYTKKELDDAINKVNNFLKDEKTHAEYSVHKDFGTLMIKIIDDKSKEVIMELPPEKILDMIASICKQFGLFDKKA